MELFKDDKLIPSTFDELGGILNLGNINQIPNIQQVPNSVITRPILSSFDKKKSIMLATERLDFVINNQTQYNNLEFNATSQNKYATTFAEKIFNKYSINSNRLALNTELIIDDLTDNFNKFFNRLFNPIPFYQNTDFRDWSQRISTRKTVDLNSSEEELNVIMVIRQNYMQVNNDPNQVHKKIININFDINTAQERLSMRFNKNHIAPFIKEASNLHEQILKQIEGVFGDK